MTALHASGGAFSWDYESAEQSLTAGSVHTVSHGLGALPTKYECVFVCKTAELGYAVDDEVLVQSIIDNNYGKGYSVRATTTQLKLTVLTSGIQAAQSELGYNSSNLTLGNWRAVLRAKK